MKGKLIVLEGSDGSGKNTQAKRLFEHLENLRLKVHCTTLPNYTSQSSSLIQMYLRGDFGSDPTKINPYSAALFFAVDRYATYNNEWKDMYEAGYIILSDRYVGSNLVHQTAKIKTERERNEFISWLKDLEFKRLGLPEPDLTIFLDMPPSISAMLRKKRGRTDIHEKDSEHVYKTYQEISFKENWKKISCATQNFARSTQDIHEDIFSLVEPLLLKKEKPAKK